MSMIDLITVAAAVDSAAEAEAQRKRQQRQQRKRDAEGEAAAPEKSFWKRCTTAFVTDCAALVRRGAARLCPNCCGR